jgi:hypothetical protein
MAQVSLRPQIAGNYPSWDTSSFAEPLLVPQKIGRLVQGGDARRRAAEAERYPGGCDTCSAIEMIKHEIYNL